MGEYTVMNLMSIVPQSFFSFGDVLSGDRSMTGIFFHASQQLAHRKETDRNDLFVNRINARVSDLKDKATEMYDGNPGRKLFEARAVSSANNRVVTGEARDSAFLSRFNIKVKRTATSQAVVSDVFKRSESMGLTRTFYDFSVNRGYGDSERIRVNIRLDDTNKEVLNKVADAINDAGIGISAEVQENFQARTVRLEIEGIDRSEMSSIALKDESGDLLKRLGISTSQYSDNSTGGLNPVVGDALVEINGQEFTSDSNRIYLYDGTLIYNEDLVSTKNAEGGFRGNYRATFDLKGTNIEDIQTDITKDNDKIAAGIEDFYGSFNRTIDTMDYSPVFAYASTSNYLNNIMERNANDLADAGVTSEQISEKEKEYRVGSEKLLDSLRNNFSDLKDLFAGAGGIAQKSLFGIDKLTFAPMIGFSIFEADAKPTNYFYASGFLFDGHF